MWAAGAKSVAGLSKAMGWVGDGNNCMIGNASLKLLMVWHLRVVIARPTRAGFPFQFYHVKFLLRTLILVTKKAQKNDGKSQKWPTGKFAKAYPMACAVGNGDQLVGLSVAVTARTGARLGHLSVPPSFVPSVAVGRL